MLQLIAGFVSHRLLTKRIGDRFPHWELQSPIAMHRIYRNRCYGFLEFLVGMNRVLYRMYRLHPAHRSERDSRPVTRPIRRGGGSYFSPLPFPLSLPLPFPSFPIPFPPYSLHSHALFSLPSFPFRSRPLKIQLRVRNLIWCILAWKSDIS